jgi:hypothetical protein
MAKDFAFSITTTRFDEDYAPSPIRVSRPTSQIARGAGRRQNLRNALSMIDRRFNELAVPDDPSAATYTVELDIVSAVSSSSTTRPAASAFPSSRFSTSASSIVARVNPHRGIVGNNFSSYVRDYDFSVVLPAATKAAAGTFTVPRTSVSCTASSSSALCHRCLSAALRGISGDLHQRVDELNLSPHGPRASGAGCRVPAGRLSLTDEYFARMGLEVRYFMPRGAVAPLAFYFRGDLLNDFSDLQLIGTIARWRRSRRSIVPRSTTPSAPPERCTAPPRPGRLRPHGHRLRP